MHEATEDFKKKNKREKRGRKGLIFFLVRTPLPLATDIKIGGGASKLTRRQPKTKKNWRQRRDFLAARASTSQRMRGPNMVPSFLPS